MSDMPTKDAVVNAVMGFVPHTVRYVRVTEMDYRSSSQSIQVIDLR